MTYSVVPFVARIGPADGAAEAAKQLEELVNDGAKKGWKFLRLESVEVIINHPGSSGCFGFGAVPPSTQITRYDMAVFEG